MYCCKLYEKPKIHILVYTMWCRIVVVVQQPTYHSYVFGIGEFWKKQNTTNCTWYRLLCTRYQIEFFPGILHFSRPAAGLPSHSRLRGTQGARVYTTAQMRAPAEVRGACSGPPKPRPLANNYGESFRPARAKQGNGYPTISTIFILMLYHV